jgi:hypothetical protein
MGLVLMSKKELNRIDVLVRLDGGRLTTAAATQTHRLLKRTAMAVRLGSSSNRISGRIFAAA